MAGNKVIKVIDASVILKCILEEEAHQQNAIKILQDAYDNETPVYVPEHTYTEVANILAIKNYEEIGEELHDIFDQKLLAIQPHNAMQTDMAVEIMARYKGVSFYDAIYHAMAIMRHGTFITADTKYYEKTKALGHSMLLKDYPV